MRVAFDLDQKLRARKRRDDHRRARGRVFREERAPHLVHRRKICLAREEHGALVHLGHGRAGRLDHSLNLLEHTRRLAGDVWGIELDLPGHVDDVADAHARRDWQWGARCCGRRRDYVAGQRWCLRGCRSDEQGKDGCGRDDQRGERLVGETKGNGGAPAQRAVFEQEGPA